MTNMIHQLNKQFNTYKEGLDLEFLRDGFLIFINTLKYSKNTEKQKDSYLYILLKYFIIL